MAIYALSGFILSLRTFNSNYNDQMKENSGEPMRPCLEWRNEEY